jgi:hypothetical protein
MLRTEEGPKAQILGMELFLSGLGNAKSAANLSHQQVGDFVVTRHWLAPGRNRIPIY